MAQSKHIVLSGPEQIGTFEALKEEVEGDLDALGQDLDTYAGEPTNGEILRVAAEAYLGRLSFT